MRARLLRKTSAAWATTALACGAALAAQPAAPSTPPESPPARLHHASWHSRSQIVVDGDPTPLFWAVGFTSSADLEAYAADGFNTVEIVIAAPTDDAWKAASDLAQAAASRGLYVLLTLAPQAAARASPFDDAYRKAVSDYLGPIVQRGSELPGVVGWIIDGVDAEALRFNQADFWRYLLRWHGSAPGVTAAWGVPVDGPDKLTEGFVAEVDSKRPLGVGAAAIDLARYKAQVYADLLEVWATDIHRLDLKHVVLAGRQHTYRAAISVPTSCDGMLLGLYPGLAENDLETHNVHGVDIARRGNQFAALPVLRLEGAPTGAQVASWVAQAVLHGAAGIGIASWDDIRRSESLQRDLRQALLASAQLRLCPRVPVASAAVLYEPFAAGGLVEGRPLYGWLIGASIAEPGKLIRTLSRGTVFGHIDYLSESSLEGANLDRYGVIVAPLALSLNASEQTALAGYVARGGTLLADLGVGAAQSGALDRLPPELARLFGITFVPGVHEGPVSLIVMTPQSRFPSLRREMGTGTAPVPASFDPPIYYVDVKSAAGPVLAVWGSLPTFAGVVARPEGKGWAVYATTRLWQDWLPGNRVFDAFHRDLFGLASAIALKQAEGVTPQDDVGLFEDGSVMLLKRTAEPSEVLIRNPKGTVYRILGGMEEIRSAEASSNSLLFFGRNGLQVAEPLPIEVATDAPRLLVQMVDYSEQGLSFALYGPATRVMAHSEAGLGVDAGGAAIAHVRIGRGAYRVTKASRHEIRIRGLREHKAALSELTVGVDGLLAFDAPANTVVTVTRASPTQASSAQ